MSRSIVNASKVVIIRIVRVVHDNGAACNTKQDEVSDFRSLHLVTSCGFGCGRSEKVKEDSRLSTAKPGGMSLSANVN
jgi:hypothetical protein